MVIADDILLFPMRGLLFIFREIHKAVQQEFKNEAEAIRSDFGFARRHAVCKKPTTITWSIGISSLPIFC